MARGGSDDLPYDLRKTTMDLRQISEEKDRQRQQLEEQRRQRDDALTLLNRQMDHIRQSRRENRLGSGRENVMGGDNTPAYVRTGRIDPEESQRDEAIAILKKKKEDMIQDRNSRRKAEQQQGCGSYIVVDELDGTDGHSFNQGLTLLEDIVYNNDDTHQVQDFDVDKETTEASSFSRINELLDRKEERLRQLEESLWIKEKKMEEDSRQRINQFKQQQDFLRMKEKKMEEEFSQRINKLQEQQEQFSVFQEKMERNFEDITRRLAEREDRLNQNERILDDKYTLKREPDTHVTNIRLKEEQGVDRRDTYFDYDLEDLNQQIAALERDKRESEKLKTKESKIEKSPKQEVKQKEDKINVDTKLSISSFSGAFPRPKHEVTFEDLTLEVDRIRLRYHDDVIKESLRKALKGQAKRKMLHLNPSATLDEVMLELQDNFGMIANRDTLLSKLLLSEQEYNESVVDWSLRLEDLMLNLDKRSTMDEEEKDSMLKKRFWRGLKDEELRQATRTHFESKISYAKLRNKVREEEYEIQVRKDRNNNKPKVGKVQQTQVNNQEQATIGQLMKKIDRMDKKIEDLSRNNQQQDTYDYNSQQYNGYNQRGRGYNRGYGGRNRRGSSSTRRNPPERTPLPKPTQEEGKKEEKKEGGRTDQGNGDLNE